MTREIFALLTRIRMPEPQLDLRRAARQQHLFPLIGLVIGLIAALAAILLEQALHESLSLVSGIMVVMVLYFVTGILHTEGLADFADGLMASGDREAKTRAMKDVNCGAAGVIAILLTVGLLVVLSARLCEVASRDVGEILPWVVPAAIGFAIAEMSGKISMIVAMYLGPSAHPGMGAMFTEEASATKLLAALAIAGLLGFALSGLLFPIVFSGVFAGVAVTMLARRHFGGVSGDVFGAANDVGRVAALLLWVLII